jgi:hypothetical protein
MVLPSDSIRPATKYPVKQSPAPVVSRMSPRRVAAGRYIGSACITEFEPLSHGMKATTPCGPRVQTTPVVENDGRRDRRNKVRKWGLSEGHGMDQAGGRSDSSETPVSASCMYERRPIASISLITNHRTLFHGMLLNCSDDGSGEGL